MPVPPAESRVVIALVIVSGGRFDHPRLPYPLTDLKVDFRADNQGLAIDDLQARNGQATLRLAGQMRGFAAGAPLTLQAHAEHLLLGRQWEAILPEKLLDQWRKFLPAGEINADQFLKILADASPSAGHCNVMGTALSMNCLAEAMGMALPGTASIPAPWRERGQMAYAAGLRAVRLVEEDLRPSRILTRAALVNATESFRLTASEDLFAPRFPWEA